MSTKSTKKYAKCDVCCGHGCCYEVPFVVMGDDFLDYFDLHLLPCEFFGWLGALGNVVRITFNHSEFFDDYHFFVGSHDIAVLLPNWVTDDMLTLIFDCEVEYVFGGGYNG